jgi:ferritin-like metal-binding protein YciE
MRKATLDDHLNAYLADAHAIEEQALAQLRVAPELAGDDLLAGAFRRHHAETEQHERTVRARLEERGGAPSRLKDLTMKLGGKGFVLFARSQPDTPGKLAAHAYSYEALELASYELLGRVAARAGDEETVRAASAIGAQERLMLQRLEAGFGRAAAASVADRPDLALQVPYLADAHALEEQSIGLLSAGAERAGDPVLEQVFAEHLEATRAQRERLELRLQELDGDPARHKDAALRIGALNWSSFFQTHPDTPGKLAAFAFAFEHLEVAGYELLAWVAARAGDFDTAALARSLAGEERAAAVAIRATFDHVVDTALNLQGVGS